VNKVTKEGYSLKDMAVSAAVSTINSPYFWILVGIVGTVAVNEILKSIRHEPSGGRRRSRYA
jgi:hypothetical protein